MDNTYQTINKLYSSQKGFYEQYGVDLIIATVIIYIFLIWTSYFYVMNHLPLLRKNWSENKCNPLYIPLAGFIINDKNKSNMEVVSNNFSDCTQNILTSIASDAFKPIYYITHVLTETLGEITKAINGVRTMFNKVRTNVKDTAVNISGRTLNVTAPILQNNINAASAMGKAHGVLTTSIYTLFGTFTTTESFFLFLRNVITGLLIILAASIVALWGLSLVPVAGIAAAAAAALATAGYIAILIPFLIVIFLISKIFDVTTQNVPNGPPGKDGRDSCFEKNTLIKLNDNNYKAISDINIGDILHDGSIVTGTMKMSTYGNSIYNFNDIIVTGLHRVYHPTKGWIKISDHPDAYEIKDNREEIVYCLNTNTKVIKINGFTFSDWDDLDDNDIQQINKKCTFIPNYIDNNDIHKYLDNGFDENTLIEMEIGTFTKIKNIEVNDILRFGERVLGIVKIDSGDISAINEYKLKNNTTFRCTNNIELYDYNLGNINTNILQGEPINIKNNLHQLITDKGHYHIGEFRVYDYNFTIEKYLDNTEFYSQKYL